MLERLPASPNAAFPLVANHPPLRIRFPSHADGPTGEYVITELGSVAQPTDDSRIGSGVPKRAQAADLRRMTRPLDFAGRHGLSNEIRVVVVVVERGV